MIRKMVIVNIWVEKFKIQKSYMFYKGVFFFFLCLPRFQLVLSETIDWKRANYM